MAKYLGKRLFLNSSASFGVWENFRKAAYKKISWGALP